MIGAGFGLAGLADVDDLIAEYARLAVRVGKRFLFCHGVDMIRYKCDSCACEMKSPEEQAGASVSCPNCGMVLTVPGRPLSDQQTMAPLDPPFGDQRALGRSPVPPRAPDGSAEAQAKRKKGWGNILWGGILIFMGLSGLFGGSVFTGDADIIDMGFDLLGIGMIIWGIVQVSTSSPS